MQASEVRAAGELFAGAFGGVGGIVREMHEQIAGRPFRALGIMAAPSRAIHDRVALAAYREVGAAVRVLPRAAAALIAQATSPAAPPLAQSRRGSLALGVLNGAIGDALESQGSELALPMTIRSRGRDVSIDRDALERAYPAATPLLAVFVHGLCETDEAWEPPHGRGADRRSLGYGSRLREDLGYSPLYLRYNTGLHISDNGRRLSELLDGVVGRWPVPVEAIVLAGHSMGGLVARSACHYGKLEDAGWTKSVRHIFCLGSPHLGAPLEKAANIAGHALRRVPETRPFAKLVNGRSVGIKDLRFGSCVEEDWCDCDLDAFLEDRCHEVPFLESATHYFVAATITRDPHGLAASVAGDLLVRFPSASGRGRRRRIPFEIENGRHFGGLSHFDLLNHPAVYEQIRAWLARPSPEARTRLEAPLPDGRLAG